MYVFTASMHTALTLQRKLQQRSCKEGSSRPILLHAIAASHSARQSCGTARDHMPSAISDTSSVTLLHATAATARRKAGDLMHCCSPRQLQASGSDL